MSRTGNTVQAHFAEQDAYVSAAARSRFEKALRARDAAGEVFLYPGTRHWFVEEDRRDAYDARAARLAWRRTLTFLNTHVEPPKPRPPLRPRSQSDTQSRRA